MEIIIVGICFAVALCGALVLGMWDDVRPTRRRSERLRDAALGRSVRIAAWYAYHVIVVCLAAYAVLVLMLSA
jgi:hypothetical protein